MTTITTRSGKGSPLTNDEVDANFTNLNTDKAELSGASFTGNVSFGDNDRAVFGAGSDLQIYHDGSNSYIDENGVGNLFIRSVNGASARIYSGGTASSNLRLLANSGGEITLYHSGSAKLATSSTGIDVTGTVTADGLTSAGDVAITGGSSGSTVLTLTTNALADTPLMVFQRSGGAVAGKLAYEDSNTAMSFGTTTAHELKFLTSNTERMQITSAGLVGIGTSSPDAVLTLSTSSSSDVLKLKSSASTTPLKLLFEKSATEQGIIEYNRNGDLELYNTDPDGGVLISGSASADPDLYVSHGGNVGIGDNTFAAGKLRVYDTAGNHIWLKGRVSDGNASVSFRNNADNAYNGRIATDDTSMNFQVNGSERMRIDSSGNLLVGTTSSSIYNDTSGNGIQLNGGSGQIVVAKQSSSASDPALWLNNTGVDGSIATFTKDGSPVGSIGSYNGVDLYIGDGEAGLKFSNDNNSIIPWNTSSNASRDNNTDLGGGSDRFRNLYLSSQVYANYIGTLDDTNTTISFPGSDQIRFNNGGSESARFDSSGNLLVGKTNNTLSNDGTIIRAGGELLVTNTSDIVANFNRTGTDGAISTFYKDGTTVGSIGTASGDLNINGPAGHSGIRFQAGSLIPRLNGADTDNSIDLGYDDGTDTHRFKDLYLSGSVFVDTQLRAGSGSASVPSVSFSADSDSGMFRATTNALGFSTAATERMRIDNNGNLLVGTTNLNPHTSNTAADAGTVINANGIVKMGRNQNPSLLVNRMGNDGLLAQWLSRGSFVGNISVTSTTTTYNSASDVRLKDNIVDAPSASDDIDAIQVRSFDWKADGSHQKYGMVAQELQSVAPDAVSEGDTEEDMMGVDYSKLVPMLVKEIQSLRARVAQLEND